MSYVSRDSSGYKIDPAELFRVFPNSLGENDNERSKERLRTRENGLKNTENRSESGQEVQLLRERLRDKDERIAELKQERDQWKEEKDRWHQTATRLMLTYQPDNYASDSDVTDSQPQNMASSSHSSRLWLLVALTLLVGLIVSAVFMYERQLQRDNGLSSSVQPAPLHSPLIQP